MPRSNRLLRLPSHYYQSIYYVLAVASTVFEILSWKGENAQFTKGHYSWNIFRMYSKLNQVIYSSLPINKTSFKALAPTGISFFFFFFFFFFYRFFADKVKYPNVQRVITLEVLFRAYSKANQVIYLSLPIHSWSLKALSLRFWDILLKMVSTQIFKGPLLKKYFFFWIYQSIHQVLRLYR